MSFSNVFRSAIGMGILEKGTLLPDTTINAVVDFILQQLPNWVDNPFRPCEDSENKLNSSLCDFLDVQAREKFNLIRFHHEQPEDGQRRVDLSVKAAKGTGIKVSEYTYSIYEPFFEIEGKRLFNPSDKKREREYVTSEDGATGGGIQRFKLGAHGAQIDEAALIGYVQEGGVNDWFTKINQWIDNLSNAPQPKDIFWSMDEKLNHFSINGKISKAISVNKRNKSVCENSIKLYHLWVNMQ